MCTVEADFMYKDLRCVCIFTNTGHRCGYVGVNKEHLLYGKNYSDELPSELVSKWQEIMKGPIGKRGVIDLLGLALGKTVIGLLFDVHGGITYSGSASVGYPVKDDRWYFGFDCAHCDDGKDLETAARYGYKLDSFYICMEGEVRTLEYVKNECISLAEQLISIVTF